MLSQISQRLKTSRVKSAVCCAMSNLSPFCNKLTTCDLCATRGAAQHSTCSRSGSGPDGRAPIEVRRGRLHHAKALAGRRFHHPPGLDRPNPLRAQPLQAADLGLDVVSLDIE